MPARLFVHHPLSIAGDPVSLDDGASRHVQVLRLQPGDAVTLFDGRGGEWSAEVIAIGRRKVDVRTIAHLAQDNELPLAVTLALAMPTNDRMDSLVEKATELGVAAIVPLVTERTVLRLAGERAARRQAHWQAIAVAACEQCGRNRVPAIQPVQGFAQWLARLPAAAPTASRLLLGWRDAVPWPQASALRSDAVLVLSGPEGGLSEVEESAARSHGFVLASLGPRVLRADTAPLAALAALALSFA